MRRGCGGDADLQRGRAGEVSLEGGRVDGGGHENEAELGTRSQRIAEQQEQEVRVHIALVHLVDNDVRGAVEVRVALHCLEQHADRAEGEPRRGA